MEHVPGIDWKKRSCSWNFSSKPADIVVLKIVEKVVAVFVESILEMICKFLKVSYNIVWWNNHKRWYHTQGVGKILLICISFLQPSLMNSFPEICRKMIGTTLHFNTRNVCSSSVNRSYLEIGYDIIRVMLHYIDKFLPQCTVRFFSFIWQQSIYAGKRSSTIQGVYSINLK